MSTGATETHYYQVRTANNSLLAEYRWCTDSNSLLMRFALCWAGFSGDGFISDAHNREQVDRNGADGRWRVVQVPSVQRLHRLYTTDVTERIVHVMAVTEVGAEKPHYLLQRGSMTHFSAGPLLTPYLDNSGSWTFESWRGAKSKIENLIGSEDWTERSVDAQAKWPEQLLKAAAVRLAEQAAKPSRILTTSEFADRMRAMRAKGAKL